jgi:predicted PurR-regulated permease PerM
MEKWQKIVVDRLRQAARRRGYVETDTPMPDEEQRPRWDSTTKVVVGIVLFVLFTVAVYAFRIVFIPLIIGVIMAYILQPVVRLIRQTTRLPHGMATGVLYLTLVALAIPVGALVIPAMIDLVIFLQNELIDFTRYLNTIGTDATVQVLGFNFGVQELVGQITSALTDFITSTARESISFVLDAARVLLLVVFTFVIGFYLTRDAERVIEWLHGLIPPAYQPDAEALMAEINTVWSAFFRGQLFLSLIVAAVLTTLSAILGLPRPLLLGIWGGLLEFLPSIGNTIWGLTVLIIALASGSTYLPLPNGIFALVVLGVYVAFAQFDINILIPNLIGRQVRLHPVVVIMGVIIGASVGGILGVGLAAPIIASLRIVVRYIYANLFDLDPFPMVGAPSLPRQERQAGVQQMPVALTVGSDSEPGSEDG